jgi:hypothetical protein
VQNFTHLRSSHTSELIGKCTGVALSSSTSVVDWPGRVKPLGVFRSAIRQDSHADCAVWTMAEFTPTEAAVRIAIPSAPRAGNSGGASGGGG